MWFDFKIRIWPFLKPFAKKECTVWEDLSESDQELAKEIKRIKNGPENTIKADKQGPERSSRG